MISHEVKTVYLMGIGGIAMGTLAAMLSEKGFRVVGSDQNIYPPMSTHLETLRIPIRLGYDAKNVHDCPADLFVIGNVIRKDNPEARYVLDRGLPYLSMPEAINRFFLPGRTSIVVAGTHGKSTTSSLLTWALAGAGMDPSAFIGAFLKAWRKSYRLGCGPCMVIEGDEYDTAFFDKGPKFLHYQPQIGMITSIEFDHADIFPNFDAVYDAFRRFVQIIPTDGFLIVNADDAHCLTVSGECKGRVVTYGWSDSSDWRVHDVEYLAGEVRFTYRNPQDGREGVMTSRLPGRHNVSNTLAVMAAASAAGVPPERIAEAIGVFSGVKRRQDIVGEVGGILVMEDFAHHPTAVKETLAGLSLFYPGRRLIAAFEPRTNSSRRSVFQTDYATAFDAAHCACIKEPPGMEAIPEAERMDAKRLVRDIRERGGESHHFADTDSLMGFLIDYALPGDLVVCMSNGSFDGLPRRLLQTIASTSA